MRRLAIVLIIALLAGGCARPRATEPSNSPAPEQVIHIPPPTAPPPEPPLATGCTPYDYGKPGGWVSWAGSLGVRPGDTCQGKAHADPFEVVFQFAEGVSAEVARKALTVTGAPFTTQVDPGGSQSRLEVHFGPGKPGERITVTVDGPLGPGGAPLSMGFDLVRVATPQVVMERLLPDGTTHPLDGRSIPPGPVTVRLQAVGELHTDLIRTLLEQRWRELPYQLQQSDDRTLLLTLAEPPPHLFLSFDWQQTPSGMYLRRSTGELYLGAPPQLVALDPATGQERPVGQVPANISSGQRSPSDPWVKLIATSPHDLNHEEIWLIHEATGQLERTGIPSPWIGGFDAWASGQLVAAVSNQIYLWDLKTARLTERQSQAGRWSTLSADARYLAGFAASYRQEDQHFLAPATIVIHELATGKERRFPDLVRVRIPHSEAPPYLRMAFDGDAGLLIEAWTPPPAAGEPLGTRWVRLDLKSGALTDAKGPALIGQTTGPWSAPGPTGYAFDITTGWGDVRVKGPDGKVVEFGPGKPLAWTADGLLLVVRWANGRYHRGPVGL